jgi:signal transduction histidine kinase
MKITSISRKLLTIVLSFYFLLTISVTGIQIAAEYINTKNHINSELLTLERTISGSLTRALWELNTQQAIDISEGLIAIPMIKGISVTDEANNIMIQLGEVISHDKIKVDDKDSNNGVSQVIDSFSDSLFGHSFPLIFEFSGRKTSVGQVTLLSSNSVIFSRIEVGIYFLIGNAVVKTTFLVFLFTIAFNKLLTAPLQELTDQISQVDLDDPEGYKLHKMTDEKNELSILRDAYNSLIDELINFKSQLVTSQLEINVAKEQLDEQNIQLEQEVARKTSSLSSTMLKMEIQQKELLEQKKILQDENILRSRAEKILMTANKELKNSNLELNKAKERLLESEKIATLGMLSAEVAHELNTPVGISIISASYLLDLLSHLEQGLNQKKLSKKIIEKFIDNASQSTKLLIGNLNRSSDLITSFKHVAADQVNDKTRLISMSKYLDEIIQSLHPKLKKTNHIIKLNCDNSIEISSHPGAIAQIMINLILNSIIHGFEHISQGEITIDISLQQQNLHLDYKDNGQGLTQEGEKELFTPFYTTKGNQGGTGLGTHIIHNLVVDSLNGSIVVENNATKGLGYHIQFPDMRYQ